MLYIAIPPVAAFWKSCDVFSVPTNLEVYRSRGIYASG